MPRETRAAVTDARGNPADEAGQRRLASLWLLLSGLGVAATWWMLWGTTVPLGIPGEWTWDRLNLEADVPWNLVVSLPFAAILLGLTWFGASRIDRASRLAAALQLGGLMMAAFAWLWVVQEAGPTAQRLSKGPFVLFYPQSSGYFYKVRYESRDVRSFLAGYEGLMAEGDVLHVGTHPPGLFLVFFGLHGLCAASPALTDGLLATQPESVQLANESVVENSAASHPPREVTRADLATLWLASLLAQGLAVLTIAPLYGLLRRTESRATAFLLSACWPLVPAAAIFLPKSDVAYAGLAVLWMWSWITAVDRHSWGRVMLSGAIAWICLMSSLAFLPVFLAGVLIPVIERATEPERGSRLLRLLILGLAAAGSFMVLTGLMWLLGEINLLDVWWLNYRNHAGFYGQFPRSYVGWLLLNPLELVLAIGVPLAILAVSGVLCGWKDGGRTRAVSCGLAVVWALLWLTGKNSGEAARLWCLLMPWSLWLAGPALRRLGTQPPAAGGILLQLFAQVVTVLRVGGFHF